MTRLIILINFLLIIIFVPSLSKALPARPCQVSFNKKIYGFFKKVKYITSHLFMKKEPYIPLNYDQILDTLDKQAYNYCPQVGAQKIDSFYPKINIFTKKKQTVLEFVDRSHPRDRRQNGYVRTFFKKVVDNLRATISNGQCDPQIMDKNINVLCFLLNEKKLKKEIIEYSKKEFSSIPYISYACREEISKLELEGNGVSEELQVQAQLISTINELKKGYPPDLLSCSTGASGDQNCQIIINPHEPHNNLTIRSMKSFKKLSRSFFLQFSKTKSKKARQKLFHKIILKIKKYLVTNNNLPPELAADELSAVFSSMLTLANTPRPDEKLLLKINRIIQKGSLGTPEESILMMHDAVYTFEGRRELGLDKAINMLSEKSKKRMNRICQRAKNGEHIYFDQFYKLRYSKKKNDTPENKSTTQDFFKKMAAEISANIEYDIINGAKRLCKFFKCFKNKMNKALYPKDQCSKI